MIFQGLKNENFIQNARIPSHYVGGKGSAETRLVPPCVKFALEAGIERETDMMRG